MLFVLPGNPNMMRSIIASCCLMLKLVRFFHHKPLVFQKSISLFTIDEKVRYVVYLIAVRTGFTLLWNSVVQR